MIIQYTLYRYPGPSSSSPVNEGEEEFGSEDMDTLLHRPWQCMRHPQIDGELCDFQPNSIPTISSINSWIFLNTLFFKVVPIAAFTSAMGHFQNYLSTFKRWVQLIALIYLWIAFKYAAKNNLFMSEPYLTIYPQLLGVMSLRTFWSNPAEPLPVSL